MTQLKLDRERFRRLWHRLVGAGPRSADQPFARLVEGYGEAWRRYHGTAHLLASLAHWDQVAHLAERPDEVEMALWYHDVLYDPRATAGHNERASAELARAALLEGGAASEHADRVAALILVTTHEATPADADGALLADIDLAILGSAPAEFARFERAIREEYAHVPDAEFRHGRAAVLRHFLERPAIYGTAHFRARAESAARANLAGRLAQLEREAPG